MSAALERVAVIAANKRAKVANEHSCSSTVELHVGWWLGGSARVQCDAPSVRTRRRAPRAAVLERLERDAMLLSLQATACGTQLASSISRSLLVDT